MVRWIGFLCVFFLLFSLSSIVESQITGDLRVQTGYDTIYGSVEQSSLEEGFHYTVDLTLYLLGYLESGWDYYSSVAFRKSTDVLLEKKDHLQLKRFLLTISQDSNEFRLGDLYTDLGQYYFNQRYRGLDIRHEVGPLQFSGLFGERHYGEEGVRYARYNYGLRLDIPLSAHDSTVLSLITATTFDDPLSLEESIHDPITNSVHGLMVQSRLQPFFLQGNLSYSYQKEGKERMTGESLFLQGDYQLNQVLFSASFEHVSPYFVSLGGTTVSDRQTINLRLRARVFHPFDVDLRYTYFHNNIAKQLEETTTQQIPRLQFTWSPLALRGLRITGWATGLNRISSNDTLHYDELTLGLRLLQRIQLLTLEAGVEQYYKWDYKEREEDEEGLSYTASLRGRYPLEKIILQPGIVLTWREEQREEETILSPLFQVEMGLTRDSFSTRLSYGERYREIDGVYQGGRKSVSLSLGYQFSTSTHVELNLSQTQQFFSDIANNYEDQRVSLTYSYRF